MQTKDRILLDTNILVYLSDTGAEIHETVKPQETISDIEKWETLFRVIDETQEITDHLKNLILKYNLKGKKIHDANIVASMIEFSIPLLFTFNVRDFRVFEEIKMMEIGAVIR